MDIHSENRKILGVIGGLGPMASAYFMRLVTEMTDAKTDQEHIEILLHSKPQIPDRTGFIIGESKESPLPGMLEAGQGLRRSGADIIAIPCVTAHFFQKTLEEEIGIPVLNAIEDAAEVLKQAGVKTAGIMATDGTVKSELFPKVFKDHGLECVIPSADRQRDVMHVIYHNVKAGIPIEKDRFMGITRELFDKGAEAVILGCTELSIMKRDNPDILQWGGARHGFLDILEVLAQSSVRKCGKLKAEYEKLI